MYVRYRCGSASNFSNPSGGNRGGLDCTRNIAHDWWRNCRGNLSRVACGAERSSRRPRVRVSATLSLRTPSRARTRSRRATLPAPGQASVTRTRISRSSHPACHFRFESRESDCVNGIKSDTRGAVVSGTTEDGESILYGTRLCRMHGREEISDITRYPLRRTRYPDKSRLFTDFDRGARQPDDADTRGGR